jgi:cysteine desulfurase / selenocysteine lyase
LSSTFRGVRLIGTAQDKASVLSFVLAGHETAEVGAALDRHGIAVRTGVVRALAGRGRTA